MQNLGLIPLINFADLGNNLYRSAQPHYSYQYKWLKEKLNIDILISLRKERNIDIKHGEDLGISTYSIPVVDGHPPSVDDIERFISILDSNKGKKILFHCLHGQGRTSTFCIASRIHEGYSLQDAIDEEINLFGFNFKHESQIRFLKQLYDKT